LQVGLGEETTLVVRTADDPASMAEAVRRSVSEVNPDAPVFRVQTMTQVLADSTVPPRFNMILMTLFAILALALAAIGLYSVISYSVTQRTQEIGIRLALWAQQRDVLKLVVGQGLRLALLGVGIGGGLRINALDGEPIVWRNAHQWPDIDDRLGRIDRSRVVRLLHSSAACDEG